MKKMGKTILIGVTSLSIFTTAIVVSKNPNQIVLASQKAFSYHKAKKLVEKAYRKEGIDSLFRFESLNGRHSNVTKISVNDGANSSLYFKVYNMGNYASIYVTGKGIGGAYSPKATNWPSSRYKMLGIKRHKVVKL